MLIDSAAVWALLDLNTDKPIAGSLTGPADGTIPAMPKAQRWRRLS